MRENFHLRCLQCILWIQRLNKVPNSEVLKSTNMDSMFALLCEWHLHCLGHISQMELGCILEGPGELMKGLRPSKTKHPWLHFKDVCKKDMKLCSINTMAWKPGTLDRSVWRLTVRRTSLKREPEGRQTNTSLIRRLLVSATHAIETATHGQDFSVMHTDAGIPERTPV